MKLRKVRIGGNYQEDSKKPETKPEENAMADVNKWMIDSSDAVMLLIDHQSGLLFRKNRLKVRKSFQEAGS
jgi:hypothetical protein